MRVVHLVIGLLNRLPVPAVVVLDVTTSPMHPTARVVFFKTLQLEQC